MIATGFKPSVVRKLHTHPTIMPLITFVNYSPQIGCTRVVHVSGVKGNLT